MNFTATVYVFPQNTVLDFLNYLKKKKKKKKPLF